MGAPLIPDHSIQTSIRDANIFSPRLPANQVHIPSPNNAVGTQGLVPLVGVQKSSRSPLKTQAASRACLLVASIVFSLSHTRLAAVHAINFTFNFDLEPRTSIHIAPKIRS